MSRGESNVLGEGVDAHIKKTRKMKWPSAMGKKNLQTSDRNRKEENQNNEAVFSREEGRGPFARYEEKNRLLELGRWRDATMA